MKWLTICIAVLATVLLVETGICEASLIWQGRAGLSDLQRAALNVGADNKQLHEDVLYPTVLVTTEKASGSGTVIYSRKMAPQRYETYILTNHHVIDDAISVTTEWDSLLKRDKKVEHTTTVWVEFYRYHALSQKVGTVRVEADIKAYSNKQDIALLKLRDPKPVEYVADIYQGEVDNVHIFDKVYIVGAAMGHTPIQTHGEITSMSDEIENYSYWMSNAAIIYGNSGGSVYLIRQADDGKTQYLFTGIPSRIAVNISGFSADPITHMGYFIPIDRIKKWLKDVCYHFIYDDSVTPEECDKLREKKRQEGIMQWRLRGIEEQQREEKFEKFAPQEGEGDDLSQVRKPYD